MQRLFDQPQAGGAMQPLDQQLDAMAAIGQGLDEIGPVGRLGAFGPRRAAERITQAVIAVKPEAVDQPACPGTADRKSVVSGKRVSVRVDLGGRRIIKKKTITRLANPI